MPEDKKATSTATAEKDGMMDMIMPMMMPTDPYEGVMSFDEMDSVKSGEEYSQNVSDLTCCLRSIVENIAGNEDLSADDKAARISQAASDFRDRVNALQSATKENLWGKVKSLFSNDEKRTFTADQRQHASDSGAAMPDGSFPIESVSDLHNAVQAIGRAKDPSAAKAHIKKRARALGASDQLPDGWKDLEIENRGFKVYTDNMGNKRWLSLSSNAFEDYDKELFTTKALEEAIEYADKTGERGPLLVFHVPSAEIGQCDFQGMAGRFLVESGTFDDTPLGRKAVEYYSNTKEENQVSIGYRYIKGDELDGQYDWMRFRERSVLPYGTAANPWTDFTVIGDDPMEEIKAVTLRKIFGDDLANGVIASAESKSKELEASGTRFKEKSGEDEFGPITDVEEVKETKETVEPSILPHIHGNVKHTHRVVPESEHVHQGLVAFKAAKKTPAEMKKAEDAADNGKDDDEEDSSGNVVKKPPFGKKEGEIEGTQMSELAGLLATLVEDVGAVRATMTTLQDEVKEIKKADEEKQRELNMPRWSLPGGIRPTESNSNIVKDEKALGDLDKEEDDLPVNPAFAYVQDLLTPGARIASN